MSNMVNIITHTAILSLVFLTSQLNALPQYRYTIPNGLAVPHPCDRTKIWNGVGHKSDLGGGELNPFGAAFRDNYASTNQRWTTALCQADSDGDGLTNGQELGDPNCVWVNGSNPSVTDVTKLSHPGVCEPIGSSKCSGKNDFLSINPTCSNGTGSGGTSFSNWCPVGAAEPGLQNLTFQLNPAVTLPSDETTYMCQSFKVPQDTDYSIVGYDVNIVRRDVVHHLILYACQDSGEHEAYMKSNLSNRLPGKCGGALTPCQTMVVAWGVGSQDLVCFEKVLGIPFGRGNYDTVLLEIHYFNSAQASGIVDSTGVIVYYTPNIRPDVKGMIVWGQGDIDIPPNTNSISLYSTGFQGQCSANELSDPSTTQFRLLSAFFHMHKTGVYGKISLTKKSTGNTIVLIDGPYKYEDPSGFYLGYTNATILEPGDSLSLECRYSTVGRNTYTTWGEATLDEMCYVFADISPPPENWGTLSRFVDDYGTYSKCQQNDTRAGMFGPSCNMTAFTTTLYIMNYYNLSIVNSCSCAEAAPARATSCSSSCYDFLVESTLLTEPCMSPTANHALVYTGMYWIAEPRDLYRVLAQTNICISTGKPTANSTCTKGLVKSEASPLTSLLTVPVVVIYLILCLMDL